MVSSRPIGVQKIATLPCFLHKSILKDVRLRKKSGSKLVRQTDR